MKKTADGSAISSPTLPLGPVRREASPTRPKSIGVRQGKKIGKTLYSQRMTNVI